MGTSKAPGTCTRLMLSSSTPMVLSSAMQALAKALVMSSLKRAWTMPILRALPSSVVVLARLEMNIVFILW